MPENRPPSAVAYDHNSGSPRAHLTSGADNPGVTKIPEIADLLAVPEAAPDARRADSPLGSKQPSQPRVKVLLTLWGHIDDMTDLYLTVLQADDGTVDGKIWNGGYDNFKVSEIAEMVRDGIGGKNVEIVTTPTDDNRSYHVSSEKIKNELGYTPKRSIEDAVRDLKAAFDAGKIKDPMSNELYYNIKRMQRLNLK